MITAHFSVNGSFFITLHNLVIYILHFGTYQKNTLHCSNQGSIESSNSENIIGCVLGSGVRSVYLALRPVQDTNTGNIIFIQM